MQTVLIIVATILVSAVIFIPVGVKIRKKIAESKIQSAEKEVERIYTAAKTEAESLRKEELIKAKEEVLNGHNVDLALDSLRDYLNGLADTFEVKVEIIIC